MGCAVLRVRRLRRRNTFNAKKYKDLTQSNRGTEKQRKCRVGMAFWPCAKHYVYTRLPPPMPRRHPAAHYEITESKLLAKCFCKFEKVVILAFNVCCL